MNDLRSLKTIRVIAVIGALGLAPGPAKAFDVATDPAFRDYKKVVAKFVRKHGHGGDNNFCISGFLTHDDRKSAWVIWRQGQKIILWEGEPDLDLSRRTLDLKSDVVPTDKDLQGSTYRVTRSWVNRITADCDRSGVKIDIPVHPN